jgi:carbamoyl-phosphate synthase large subunit
MSAHDNRSQVAYRAAERRPHVLVAGVGGASLGTEAAKALLAGGRHDVSVADVSPLAFGLYMPGVHSRTTFREAQYLDDLVNFCERNRVDVVVPGAEATLRLVSEGYDRLTHAGVACAINKSEVIETCSDKGATFERLAALELPVPRSRILNSACDIDGFPMPCVIKPSTGSGGSAMVAPASTPEEAVMYARWIWSAGRQAIAQEYLPADGGEFTVGVLSCGSWTGSIAMRREFPSKLSYMIKSARFLISTGYSQGLVDDFPIVRLQAERIAKALGSVGPLNVQGRMVGSQFVPFEVNPRFSATTFLRYMAGFREIDLFIDYLLHGQQPAAPPEITPGYYFRSLTETYVPTRQIVGEP